MKKSDIVLIIGIVVLAVGILFFVQKNKSSTDPAEVVVYVAGEEVKRLPLNKDTTYQVEDEDHINIIQIKDGVVSMIEADCPDQICVKQADISKNGEMIVCLPHQVIVKVESNEESELDTVAN